MGKADALSQIKEAEAKAKRTLEEADEKQKSIVASARREAMDKLQAAERDLRAKREAVLVQERQALAAKREELLRKGNDDAAKIKSRAAERVPMAKTTIKQHFERAFDAAAGTNE